MEHAHQCSCGSHDHEHHHAEHHSCEESEKKVTGVSVSTHDQSIVGTYQFEMDGSYDTCSSSLAAILQEVANQVADAGGIIGHIKAHLASTEKGCIISVTDETADIRPANQSHCHVEGVAIVFGITTDLLEEILCKVLPV